MAANTTKSETKKEKVITTPDTTDDSIPHPYFELYRHTMLRGANSGSLLTILFAPPILYFRGRREPREILYRTARASVYGMLIGAGLSALATWAIVRKASYDEVFDRSYRLRYNKGQVHMDFVTYGVVGSGAVAGALTTSTMRATGALLGSAVGFGLAVFVHMATKGKD